MLSKIFSATTIGIDGIIIAIEVDISPRGLPGFQIVGLPNKSVDEARVRVRSALENSKLDVPDTRIVVNLAPANLRKEGSTFDVGIAVGIQVAHRRILSPETPILQGSIFLGELSLNGDVLPVAGTLPMAIAAKELGYKYLFVPEQNIEEAMLVDGLQLIPITSIFQCVEILSKFENLESYVMAQQKIMAQQKKSVSFSKNAGNAETNSGKNLGSVRKNYVDFSEIKGQLQAKRTAEIAAAGSHNLHMSGPPGTGKTLIARAMAGILPPMLKEEIIEVAKIYSVSQLRDTFQIPTTRPFRVPHHTISLVGLIGGGALAKPGEISLAHRGVLFLDEFPEFPRYVIESLRQPLEDGVVTISRANGIAQYPSKCIFVAASNPCPCGYLGHPTRSCICSNSDVVRYKKKISGPMLDRIDIHVTVPPIDKEQLLSVRQSESSSEILKRVMKAREIQEIRFQKAGIRILTNADMSPKIIKQCCNFEKNASEMLKNAFEKFSMSPRSYFKTIKVAQTIADLDFLPKNLQDFHESQVPIQLKHMAEALQYRYEK